MAYIKSIEGYIVDVPNATFTRCDEKIFNYKKLNSFNFSPQMEPININGGQSKYILASIDAGASAEVQLTSSEFRLDIFELAHNSTPRATTNHLITETKRFDVGTGLTITLPTGATKVYIAGMEAAETVAAGKYVVATNTITFNEGDFAVGDSVEVSYKRPITGTLVDVLAEGSSAKGSLQLDWPVYSSGVDCTDAAIKGTLRLEVFRVRVSQMPGFDASLTCRLLAA